MAGSNAPVGRNGPLPPFWNAITQGMQNQAQLARQLAATSQGLPSMAMQFGVSTATFTPTNANDIETPTNGPTVTAQVGVSGKALLLATATVQISPGVSEAQQAILYYAWTPSGGSRSLPVVLGEFGSQTAQAVVWNGSIAGIAVIDKIPSGQVEFVLLCESYLNQGAIFESMAMIVWPI